MTTNPLGQMQVIHVDDQPWVEYEDETGFIPPGAAVKPSSIRRPGTPSCSRASPPDYKAPSHWHPSDTIYVITQGEFSVEGEGTYRPGDVRWVQGGTAYGSESAGPEGCEFYIVSLGPFDVNDPASDTPPRGDWRSLER